MSQELLYSLRLRLPSEAEVCCGLAQPPWKRGCARHCCHSWSCTCPLGHEVTPWCGGISPPARTGRLQGQGRCHRGAGSLPVLQILSPVISWPHCTAPAILSHLSICCFYFKFREGLVFPTAYLLFLTRLNGLMTKKSISSSQPCTSYLTFQTPPRSSCISHSSY